MSSSTSLLVPDGGSMNQAPPSPLNRINSSQSPYDRPYDFPSSDHVEASELPAHQMDESHPTQASTPLYQNDYSYQPAASASDSDSKSMMSTAKRYDHRESRMLLLRTGTYRLLITVGFSVLIGISLKAFEGFKEPYVLNTTQVRAFNALVLGLSLCLGLNLASSLKAYAVILRWYLLTRYVSLEVFDLILGVESLTKVTKLMIISLPGIGPRGRLRFLRRFPWFSEGRNDGTNLTWIACLLWLLVNVGAQILVATLSLFWPVEPSAMALMSFGNVTVANLTSWSNEPAGTGRRADQTEMDAAWSRGMESAAYQIHTLDEYSLVHPTTSIYKLDDGGYQYNFYNRDPDRLFQNYAVSSRSVQARAFCKELKIGKHNQLKNDTYLEAIDEGRHYHIPLPVSKAGSFSWSASTRSFCGSRCSNLTVYLEDDDDDIKDPSLFFCNSTLSEIQGDSKEFINLSTRDKQALYGSDAFARLAAGAIGWTGANKSKNDRQTQVYMRGTTWSPYEKLDAAEIEDLLSRFTIGAVAAFDDHGLRYNLTAQPSRPAQGSTLKIDWPWILGLLGFTCFLQLAALIFLLAFANKSIIRDDSAFSMAMLLSPVVSKIGREGMNMSGDEIKNHPKLRWKQIKYDYIKGDGAPNQVDIMFLGRGELDPRRSWEPGFYT